MAKIYGRARIPIMRGTTQEWETENPILLEGELGLDTELLELRAGNGSGHWKELPILNKGNNTGSGSGTTNYNLLTNKPRINGVELKGNKTSAELGLTSGGTSKYPELTEKPQINGVELVGDKNSKQLNLPDINKVSATKTAQGERIVISDSNDSFIRNFKLFGKTIQNGVPTPEKSVALETTGSQGSIKITVNSKSITIPTVNGVNGIKVPQNGSSYVDSNGTSWIGDEVDIEREVYVKKFVKFKLSPDLDWTYESSTKRFIGHTSLGLTYKVGEVVPLALCSHLVPTFQYQTTIDNSFSYINEGAEGVAISIYKFGSDVNKLKQFLRTNEVWFVWELKTPTETQLSSDIAKQIKELRTSYSGPTTISNDSNVVMSLDYGIDTRQALDSKQDRQVYGKSVWIGDSIGKGQGNNDRSYIDFAKESGLFETVEKYAMGSTCIGPYYDPDEPWAKGFSGWEQLNKHKDSVKNADYLFFQFCSNDINAVNLNVIQIGKHTDSAETNSVCGWARKCLNMIFELNPDITMYFLSLAYSEKTATIAAESVHDFATDHSMPFSVEDYVNTWKKWEKEVIEVFKEFNVPIIYMLEAPVNLNEKTKKTLISSDKMHPSDIGQRKIFESVMLLNSKYTNPYNFKFANVTLTTSTTGTSDRTSQQIYEDFQNGIITFIKLQNGMTSPITSYASKDYVNLLVPLLGEAQKIKYAHGKINGNTVTLEDIIPTAGSVFRKYGKSVWIGDSIGQGHNNDDYSYIDVAKDSGLFESVLKLSQNSACIGPYGTNTEANKKSGYNQIMNNQEAIKSANLLFFEFCFNDLSAYAGDLIQVGKSTDEESSNTMCGWAKKCLNQVFKINPAIKIYFLDLAYSEHGIQTAINGGIEYYKDLGIGAFPVEKFKKGWLQWRKELIDVFKSYNVPVIYLLEEPSCANPLTTPTLLCNDHLHPSTKGHQRLFETIINFHSTYKDIQRIEYVDVQMTSQTAGIASKSSQEIYEDYKRGITTIGRLSNGFSAPFMSYNDRNVNLLVPALNEQNGVQFLHAILVDKNLTITPYEQMIKGDKHYTLKTSTTVPTVDDKNVITFVV